MKNGLFILMIFLVSFSSCFKKIEEEYPLGYNAMADYDIDLITIDTLFDQHVFPSNPHWVVFKYEINWDIIPNPSKVTGIALFRDGEYKLQKEIAIDSIWDPYAQWNVEEYTYQFALIIGENNALSRLSSPLTYTFEQ
jgi:hypothetical protein